MKAVALVLALISLAAGQAPAKETLLQKLLRIAGLTAAPSQMRAPGDVPPGEIWITDVATRSARALATGALYHSPVFDPADTSVYALRDDGIVRIPATGGASEDRGRAPGALKLVGFDGSDDLVVLIEPPAGGSPLAAFSIKTGRMTPLPHDPGSSDEQRLLAFVRGAERVYGDTRVYTRTESKRGLSRTLEWQDVYLARGDAPPVNVSMCGGVDCGEPALSRDGRRVVFVKADAASAR